MEEAIQLVQESYRKRELDWMSVEEDWSKEKEDPDHPNLEVRLEP